MWCTVRHTRSTHEGVQCLWRKFHSFAIYQKLLMGMAVVLHVTVCSTCEAHPQYLKGTPKVSMRVWAVLLRVQWVCLQGTAHAHRYFGCASRVLHTLMGTAHTCTLYKVTLDPLCTDECHTTQHSNLSNPSNPSPPP